MKARRAPPASYELVDHTADLGLRVRGESLSDLFAAAGLALADLLYDPETVGEGDARDVTLEAASAEELLVKWLNELLYLRDAHEFLWRTLEVDVKGETHLSAALRGEGYQPERHVFRTELKAATYHQLRIAREPEGWGATVILDV